eukprot:CAMPEP_0114264874 /NCGR_PEP_ID=MMETSP0058-20121206/23500_1 /TAXON_ID=36894 /ORGANISM="Pyramimonas parkeae, CCMP726" /LENGTH=63 /DNA_ID=CAMNT_0001381699 /DNA_START=365 /DNA_END=553 /DNA_ORIENTATION=+
MNNTPFDNIMGTQCGPTDEKNELMPNGQTGEKSGVSRFDIRCAEGGGLAVDPSQHMIADESIS